MSARERALNGNASSSPVSSGPETSPVSLTPLQLAQAKYQEALQAYHDARVEVMREFLTSYYGVVVYGSARLDPEHKEYQQVYKTVTGLVEELDGDLVIVTGGGPGIMKAAVDAARSAGASDENIIGVRIDLNIYEPDNERAHIISHHPDGGSRLEEMLDYSHAAIIGPGGAGSFAELGFILQAIQLGKVHDGYTLIVDPYWEPVVKAFREQA